MVHNPHLDDALRIFDELGWADPGVGPGHAPDLPLGSPAQRSLALAGLRWGDWEEWRRTRRGVRHVDHVAGRRAMLALFAIRLGVSAERAAAVCRDPDFDAPATVRVVAARGPDFAGEFVAAMCAVGPTPATPTALAPLWCEGLLLALVERLGLEVPDSPVYLHAWARRALERLEGEPSDAPNEEGADERVARHDLDLRSRFEEHATRAVDVGLGATQRLGRLLPAAVRTDWTTRDRLVAWSLDALTRASRPGDRKVWVRIALGDAQAGDAELAPRVAELLPVLALGEAAVTKPLGPRVLAVADEHDLPGAAEAALSTTTATALRPVLDALLARTGSGPWDAGRHESLGRRLAELAAARDAGVAIRARRLLATLTPGDASDAAR